MKNLVLTCSFLLIASVALAGPNSWTAIGPGGSPVETLVVSPHSITTVYAGSEAGLFRSDDAGQTWTALYTELPAHVFHVALDPHYPNVIYIATSTALMRSDDAGRTWTQLRAESVDAMHVDHDSTLWVAFAESGLLKSQTAGESWQSGGSLSNVTDIASVGNMLYAAANGRLQKSTNAGGAWNPITQASWYITEVAAIDHAIYAGGLGVWRSNDTGGSWVAMTTLSDSDAVTEIVMNRAHPEQVMITFLGNAVISDNSGVDWYELDEAIAHEPKAAAFSGDALLVGTRTAGVLRTVDRHRWLRANGGMGSDDVSFIHPGPRFYLGTRSSGLFVTINGGATWQSLAPGSTAFSFAADLSNPNAIYLGTGGEGILRSTDGGATFFRTGPYTTVHSIAANGTTVFAAIADEIHRSTDAGVTWQFNRRSPFFVTVRELAMDPVRPATVYATTNPVSVTVDNGATWMNANVGDNFMRALLIVPGNPSTVYVAGPAVWRADSGSTSFTRTSSGLPTNVSIDDLGWNASTNTLFAVVSPNGTVPVRSQLYVSRDRGTSWQPYAVQPDKGLIQAVASSGQTIWAGSSRGLYELSEPPIPSQPRRRSVRK